jgi:hypothetical protein
MNISKRNKDAGKLVWPIFHADNEYATIIETRIFLSFFLPEIRNLLSNV